MSRIRRIHISVEWRDPFEPPLTYTFDYVPTSDDDPFVDAVVDKAHEHSNAIVAGDGGIGEILG